MRVREVLSTGNHLKSRDVQTLALKGRLKQSNSLSVLASKEEVMKNEYQQTVQVIVICVEGGRQ
jgi:hypothetical protein